jgi:hypothetical protein
MPKNQKHVKEYKIPWRRNYIQINYFELSSVDEFSQPSIVIIEWKLTWLNKATKLAML